MLAKVICGCAAVLSKSNNDSEASRDYLDHVGGLEVFEAVHIVVFTERLPVSQPSAVFGLPTMLGLEAHTSAIEDTLLIDRA